MPFQLWLMDWIIGHSVFPTMVNGLDNGALAFPVMENGLDNRAQCFSKIK